MGHYCDGTMSTRDCRALGEGPRLFGLFPFYVGRAVELLEKEGRSVRAHCVSPVTRLALWHPGVHVSVMLLFFGLGTLCERLDTRKDNEGELLYPFWWYLMAACACTVLMAFEVHIAKYSSAWFSDKAERLGQAAWECLPIAVMRWFSHTLSAISLDTDEPLESNASLEISRQISGSDYPSSAPSSSATGGSPGGFSREPDSPGGSGDEAELGFGRKKKSRWSRPAWTRKLTRSLSHGKLTRSLSRPTWSGRRRKHAHFATREGGDGNGQLAPEASDSTCLTASTADVSGVQSGAPGSLSERVADWSRRHELSFHVWFVWLFVMGIVTLYSRIQANTFMGMLFYSYLSGGQHDKVLFTPSFIPLWIFLLVQIGHYVHGMVYYMPRLWWTTADHRRWQLDVKSGKYAWMEWGRAFEFDINGPFAERKAIANVTEWEQWIQGDSLAAKGRDRGYKGGPVELYRFLGTRGTRFEPLDSEFPFTAEWTQSDISGPRKEWKTVPDKDKWEQLKERQFGGQPFTVKTYRFAARLRGRPGAIVFEDTGDTCEPKGEEFPLAIRLTANRHAYTSLRGLEVTASAVMDGIAECCSMPMLLEMQILNLQDYKIVDRYLAEADEHTGAASEESLRESMQALLTLLNDAAVITRCAISRVLVHGVCYCGAYLYLQLTCAPELRSGRDLWFGVGSALVSLAMVMLKAYRIQQYHQHVRRVVEQCRADDRLTQYRDLWDEANCAENHLSRLFSIIVPASLMLVGIFLWVFVMGIMEIFVLWKPSVQEVAMLLAIAGTACVTTPLVTFILCCHAPLVRSSE